jgi:hypothetical protein
VTGHLCQSFETTLILALGGDTQFFLDDAIAACGFQTAAQRCGLFRRRKRADKSPIVDTCGAKIRAANERLAAAKLVGLFRLQRAKGSLSPVFAAL